MSSFRIAIILFAAIGSLPAPWVRAGDELFDPDPRHPWNRLHRFLYVRTLGSGKTLDYDGLDAPVSRLGKFLIVEPSHKQALILLDDFLKTNADKRIKDPLKRALMQRDLWYVFDALAQTNKQTIYLELEAEDRQPQRLEVERRLAQIMKRLALSEQEIEALPDNYSAAIRTGTFPGNFDPKNPDRPFLSPDLFSKNSPWIYVKAWGNDLGARDHINGTDCRALFTVLFRVPAGRKAAEAYVASLHPGKEAPRVPEGAMFALVRQTVLINDRGLPQASGLVEHVQLRTFPTFKEQHFYEWLLDRKDLLAGKNGGLHARKLDDLEVVTGYLPPLADPFEAADAPLMDKPLRGCIGCHQPAEDILSVVTFGGRRLEGWQGGDLTDRETQARETRDRKRMSYSWGLFKGLCEESRP